MDQLTAMRLPIATGKFGTRFAVTADVLFWARYDADGGQGPVIDADSASDTFGTVLRSFEIPVPTGAATPGEDSAGSETYVTAATPDGLYGFVSVNGDGLISAYDLTDGSEVGEVGAPGPLSGFDGYVTVLSAGVTSVDLWARPPREPPAGNR